MCVYLRAPVQEVQEHKVHSPRANSQQFPLSSTVADVPAEACRHEITRIIREGYLRASWSIESRARLVFFSLFFFPRQDRTNRPERNEKVFHVGI